MKRKKRKLKKNFRFLIFLAIIVFLSYVIFTVTSNIIKDREYKNSYEYKLISHGYSNEDAATLLKYLNDDQINDILNRDVNNNYVKFVSEKYFIYKYLDRYNSYLDSNKDTDVSKVIALVNVNRDRDYYSDPIETNTSLNELMLVNKYYYLTSSYVASDLISIGSGQAFLGNSGSKIAVDAFTTMQEEAEDDDIILIINSSYRSYETQDKTWSDKKYASGTKRADLYAARAGYSEHQTGLAFDISQYYYDGENFDESPAYQWLLNNAHKYGFILRYPEDKEDITGFSYEPWHIRYVGIEAATIIHDEGITLDEYYAYYIENK